MMLIFAVAPLERYLAQENSPDKPQTLAESLDAIKKFRGELIRENYDAASESEEFMRVVVQKVAERAKEYASFFPIDKVQSADLMKLARLYIEAGQCGEARAAVHRRLALPGLSETQKADLLLESIDVALGSKSPEGCEKILDQVDDAVRQLEAMGDDFLLQRVTAYRTASIAYSKDKDRLEKASNRYVELYKKLSPAQRSSNLRFGVYKAYINLSGIYAARGEDDRVKDAFREGVQLLSGDPDAASTLGILKYDQGRYELPGKKAAPIEAEYWINRKSDTKPLTLTGKVTLIEFTAHWCVPCKESYPKLMRLHEKYAKRGFQIVLATTLYGYFGKDKNLLPEQEIAANKKYYADELKLPFKVAIKTPVARDSAGPGGDKNARAYFAQAIPQFVVVDRKGVIRYVSAEWNPQTESHLASIIEATLDRSGD